ncbi:hypothetical protein [Paenibacillus macquariensis]|uniref:DUF1453 domain-containing protein n=1 Tax=Paenibacillus macquariensis TaxID=948756 RepID=A0ABY1JMN4_9BACL|nr:hypothetical protein [Paenibacillus macquariensis]MEC0092307.1 hypothetical protein [Paenibacillus macquariensis]OAB37152.1 hypothetical protein PMSM_03480 [Paenibacillus macquariensis subsp. macquariensis]SIQ46548.1 hypothetical protein SAMN05421578_102113 [Paenibacillus macquariensis]
MINYLMIMIISVFMLARERVIRPKTMWITPALLVFAIGMGIASTFTVTILNITILLICTIAGFILGIWRGKIEQVRIHPTHGKVTSKTPLFGIILFLVLILLRAVIGHWGETHNLVSLGNDMLMIPLVSVCLRRYYVYLKFKQFRVASL